MPGGVLRARSGAAPLGVLASAGETHVCVRTPWATKTVPFFVVHKARFAALFGCWLPFRRGLWPRSVMVGCWAGRLTAQRA